MKIEKEDAIYKVVNAERTAKVDAPSMEEAAAQFLNVPVERLFLSAITHKSAMFGVYVVGVGISAGLHKTDERVAVFEIEEDL